MNRASVGIAEILAGVIVPEFFPGNETVHMVGVAAIAVGGNNLRRHHKMHNDNEDGGARQTD